MPTNRALVRRRDEDHNDDRPAVIEPAGARQRWLEALGGADVRSLAALRIGLALIVLVDLVIRVGDLGAHYSDLGILSRADATRWLGTKTVLSAYFLSGETWWAGLLLAVNAVAAAALLLGYRTGLAALLTWYLTFAIDVRNPAIVFGGDNLLRMLLFWGLFVPWGAEWSLDVAAGRVRRLRHWRGVGVFAMRLQLCLMYWVTAAKKTGADWLVTKEAVGVALSLDRMATSWARVLRNVPYFPQAASVSTLVLEWLGPLVVWVPRVGVRVVVVAAFVAFHLIGLAPALRIGAFPWVCAVAWLAFLPGEVWDRLAVRLGRPSGETAEATTNDEAIAVDKGRHGCQPLAVSRPVQITAGVVVVVVVLSLGAPAAPTLLSPAREGLAAIGLHQEWRMFTPQPSRRDGWYVMLGRRDDGFEVDVWRSAPVDFAKPAVVHRSYGNIRWHKYLNIIHRDSMVGHRQLLARYLCREWNNTHAPDEQIDDLAIIFVVEETLPRWREAEPVPELLWGQRCAED